jgi:hypothetical protein
MLEPNTSYKEADLRDYCSVVARTNGIDPIGSAPVHQRYILVETPFPWTKKVEQSPKMNGKLFEVLKEAKEQEKSFRFLAFHSDTLPSPDGYTRVFLFERPDSFMARYQKREYLMPNHQVHELVRCFLASPVSLEEFNEYLQPSSHIRELFLCTQGSRDRCCGKFGYELYKEIQERLSLNPDINLRIWRSSHLGGHRYAPTMLDLPEGRYWGHLKPNQLDALLFRKGAFSDLAGSYRGWGAISPFEQAAEREAFLKMGWDWIKMMKQSKIVEKSDSAARVRIDYHSPDGNQKGSYEAEVKIGEIIKVWGCGAEPKDVKQYITTRFDKMNQ